MSSKRASEAATQIIGYKPFPLFIGDCSSSSPRNVHTNRFTHIVHAMSKYTPQVYRQNVKQITLDLVDGPLTDILSHFPRAFEFLDAALESARPSATSASSSSSSSTPDDAPCASASTVDDSSSTTLPRVLIHCRSGRSRSVTITCGWLMYRYHKPFAYTLRRIQKSRSIASPNYGYRVQLLLFQLSNYDLDRALRRYALFRDQLKQKCVRRSRPRAMRSQQGGARATSKNRNKKGGREEQGEEQQQQKGGGREESKVNLAKVKGELRAILDLIEKYSVDPFPVLPEELLQQGAGVGTAAEEEEQEGEEEEEEEGEGGM